VSPPFSGFTFIGYNKVYNKITYFSRENEPDNQIGIHFVRALPVAFTTNRFSVNAKPAKRVNGKRYAYSISDTTRENE